MNILVPTAFFGLSMVGLRLPLPLEIETEHVPLRVAQDPDVVDEREDIEELLETLEDHVKEKGEQDTEAIGVIDQLTQAFEDCGPKDREAIVEELEDCFKAKRRKELEPGVPDDRLYFAAATALGQMAPESVKPLVDLLGHKSHRKNIRLQKRIAMSLGNTKDPKAIEPLLDLLNHDEMQLQAAGAEALGNFDGEELETRKDIFKELLDVMMAQKSKKDVDPNDILAMDRWNTISGPIIATLQKLSGHDERDPAEWQRWWNKNKKDDWDEIED